MCALFVVTYSSLLYMARLASIREEMLTRCAHNTPSALCADGVSKLAAKRAKFPSPLPMIFNCLFTTLLISKVDT